MHIVIDASQLGERPTGVQTYILNILKALAHIDRRNKYTIFGTRFSKAELGIKNDNFSVKRIPDSIMFWYLWRLWYRTGFSAQLAVSKPDLFLSTEFTLPFCCPVPAIAVAYDIIPHLIEDSSTRYGRAMFRWSVSYAVKSADVIIAVSQSTKRDLVDLLGAVPEKIRVIYPGYDGGLFVPQTSAHRIELVKQKFNISRNYILYVGTLQANKNIPRLIEAFSLLKKEKKIEHQLVIAGKKATGYEAIIQALDKSAVRADIVLTGYVPREELPLLMTGADVFVFPSLYEGFGLPPLEAMACGMPVITSGVSSLPEVVGDAAILIDPYSVHEIADAIYRVLSDGSLRETLRSKGLERVKLFSWLKAAQQMLQLFETFSRQ